MKIKVLTGHLTPTNKTHLKALFAQKLNCGKVNRINYLIKFNEGIYKVTMVQTDNSVIYGEKINVSKATFKIN